MRETAGSSARLARSFRVATPGVRVRLKSVRGDLLNVSRTGALVRVTSHVPIGLQVPVVLDLEKRRIDVVGRVVRCERTTIELPGGAVLKYPEHAVGLRFNSPSLDALHGIAQLCGDAFGVEELPFRVLVVSDDLEISTSVSAAASAVGYQVRVAAEPRHTIAAAKQSRADVVIVNLRLHVEPPRWWVLDVLQSEPATARIPLIAIGDPARLRPERREHLGARRIRLLQHPFAPRELVSLLAETLPRNR